MNANFGLLEPLATPVKDKAQKKLRLAERALADIDAFAAELAPSSPRSAFAEREPAPSEARGSGGEA